MEKRETVRYEIAAIDILPLVRVGAVLFLIVGMIIGLFAFLVFPHPSSTGLSFSTRFLSALLFAALYTLILTISIVLLAWLYNLLTSNLKWAIAVHLSKSQPEKE